MTLDILHYKDDTVIAMHVTKPDLLYQFFPNIRSFNMKLLEMFILNIQSTIKNIKLFNLS